LQLAFGRFSRLTRPRRSPDLPVQPHGPLLRYPCFGGFFGLRFLMAFCPAVDCTPCGRLWPCTRTGAVWEGDLRSPLACVLCSRTCFFVVVVFPLPFSCFHALSVLDRAAQLPLQHRLWHLSVSSAIICMRAALSTWIRVPPVRLGQASRRCTYAGARILEVLISAPPAHIAPPGGRISLWPRPNCTPSGHFHKMARC